MQIQVVSKGIDASQALRERVTERLEEAIGKYFDNRPGEAFVAVSKEGWGFRADISLHLPSGAMLQSRGEAGEAYTAVDVGLATLEKRLRRYKRRLVDHRQGKDVNKVEPASLVVFQSQAFDEPDEPHDDHSDEAALHDDPGGEEPAEPIIVAETTAELPVFTVSRAVEELDVTQSPMLMFRNAAHGALNVVYRRPDGHIGWIDPERSRPT